MFKETYDIIIVGGGAAGMMAAGRAGELGSRVLLLEKNRELGKKLSITGGGRCNITNAEPTTRQFLEHFPQHKHFLFSPFSQFTVQDTFAFFEARGLPLIVEERNRAFPYTERAQDVCQVLKEYVYATGNVTVRTAVEVRDFFAHEKGWVVQTPLGEFLGRSLILAAGGFAAPETGSTGEWLDVVARLGHRVKAPDPNLSPLRTDQKWVQLLSGVSIDDLVLRFYQAESLQLKKRGRVLFTHFGISGPLVINSAFDVKQLLKKGPVEASIDFFPEEDLGSLDRRLVNLFEEHRNKQFRTVFRMLLQKKIADVLLKLPGFSFANVPVHSIRKDQRKKLVHFLKDARFPIKGTMGYEWSIIADGGVLPEDVDFRCMESRVCPNLFFIGDTLNINRPSGGFSLQLCWTTGWVAATRASVTEVDVGK